MNASSQKHKQPHRRNVHRESVGSVDICTLEGLLTTGHIGPIFLYSGDLSLAHRSMIERKLQRVEQRPRQIFEGLSLLGRGSQMSQRLSTILLAGVA